jgi:hypothetical protein
MDEVLLFNANDMTDENGYPLMLDAPAVRSLIRDEDGDDKAVAKFDTWLDNGHRGALSMSCGQIYQIRHACPKKDGGTGTLEEGRALWRSFEDASVAYDKDGLGRLDADWAGFSRGTPVDAVWHWFEWKFRGFKIIDEL